MFFSGLEAHSRLPFGGVARLLDRHSPARPRSSAQPGGLLQGPANRQRLASGKA